MPLKARGSRSASPRHLEVTPPGELCGEREAHLGWLSGTSVFPCFFIYGEVCSFQQCVRSLHIFDICQTSCIGEFRLALPRKFGSTKSLRAGSRPGGKKLWHRGRTQTNGRTLEA
jgi:hypothetical protein